jgi:pyruvate/2-oxoglutarate dehydrogenase complex dihydrolipoamide dehydrogenase (E3) component
MSGASAITPDWGAVARRIREEATDHWDDSAAVKRLEKAGVRFVRGHGRLAGEHTVEVDGSSFRAARGVLLNTGTEPAVPPIEGLAGTPYWTNREALRADESPKSLAVIGGGAIGVELAQVFARFDSAVTVLEVADRLLSPEEPEACRLLAEVFAREGITVTTGASISSVHHDGERFTLEVNGASVQADRLLVAAGRHPNLTDIGLDSVGLDPDRRSIEVDERMLAAAGLWAIGDITGKGAYTHMSMYQSAIAVRDILGRDGPVADYRAVPRVTFTDPEIGSVGMNERQAREAGMRVRVGFAPLPESTRGWIHKAGNDGLIKLVEDADRGVLVGATTAGPSGGEVLSMLATAVHAEVRTDTLRSMIYAYPTFHRAVEVALADLS